MISAYLTKPLTAIILAFLLLFSQKCWAENITVLQSSKLAPYQKALEGFLSVNTNRGISGQKTIQPDSVKVFYLDDLKRGINLKRKILADQPDLVVTIGNKALLQATDLPDSLPIVYLLAPRGHEISQTKKNISGIGMNITPARQLAGLIEVLPAAKRLGVIYDPKKSKDIVDEAKHIAKLHGIEIIAEEVSSDKQVLGTLTSMAHRVDSLWMLPDSTVASPVATEALLLFSFSNKIPIFTFANKYLKLGATVSASFDLFDMGVQAGRMAKNTLANPIKQLPSPENPEKVVMHLNHKMAAKLGVFVNTAALSNDF